MLCTLKLIVVGLNIQCAEKRNHFHRAQIKNWLYDSVLLLTRWEAAWLLYPETEMLLCPAGGYCLRLWGI